MESYSIINFWGWIFSLSKILWRFIQVVLCIIVCSFLVMTSISLVYMCHCFTHRRTYGLFIMFWLLQIKVQQTFMYGFFIFYLFVFLREVHSRIWPSILPTRMKKSLRFLCKCKCPFLWDKYSGVQLLSCMVVVCLGFKETAKLWARVAVPFSIPTSNVWVIRLLHIFIGIWCCHYYLF